MRRLNKICIILSIGTGFILLTGCHGLKLSFKTSSQQVAVSTEEASKNSPASSKKVSTEDTISKQADTVATANSAQDFSEEEIIEGSISEELVIEDSRKVEEQSNSVDVFEELYTFDLPDGYVLLDNQYNTATSKMYALAKRGKIVATIFMNYPDTLSYEESEVRAAYHKEIDSKYDVLLNSKMEINNFCWDGYYGSLKEENNKSGYILFDSNEGKTVYIEFMCADSYDCALDVAVVIKSFKLNKEEKEKDE